MGEATTSTTPTTSEPSSIPLIDLHRHLEGAIRPQTVLELAEQYNVPLPRNLEALRPMVQVTSPEPDLMAFIAKIDCAALPLMTLDACARITRENIEDAAREGIAYLELRFSPVFMAQSHDLDPAGIVEAVVDAARLAERDYGVRTNLIGILCRTYGPDSARRELDALLTQREHLVALDLAGDEAHFPGDLFIEHFRRGRDAGWHITVHAGEAAGAAGVWQAITELGAERIGHGVRAIDDPQLVEVLARQRIGLEMSLTSNVQTSTVPDYASHPLRRFLEAGIPATINTDDPAISGIDLPYELQVAAPAAGLSPAEIRQAQRNAIDIAFLREEEREALRRRLTD